MRIGRRGLLLSLSALAGPRLALSQSARPRAGRALDRVDEIFAAQHAKDGVASIVAGVVSGPDLIWSKGYGYSDIEARTPATADTIYRIGSITKQFTATAFLQLVKRGKVRLTDPVETYFPEVNLVQGRPAGTPPITLLQLSTHTSGLDREPGDVETYTTGAVSDWEKILIAALPHTRYAFEPGTRQVYSNIAVGTLGAALGRAAGQSYVEYATRNVIEPLGLKNTAFDADDALRPRVAHGYVLRDGKPDPEPAARELRTGRGYKVPNGAIFTTIGDLGRFVSFELGHGPATVLDKETLKDNFSRIYASNGNLGSGYGIGFSLSRQGDLVIAGHGGSVAGFVAGAYFHQASQTGVVYLRNFSRSLREEVIFDAFRELIAG
jgi:CubicO group peptidase (beta-lactamase class C family)